MNCLEPRSLIDHFLRCPPQGFGAGLSPDGLPWFDTRFDLLTTADDTLRRQVARWPGYAHWRRWLTVATRFIGTTVSEYAPLPEADLQTLADWLVQCAPDKTLLIIKDLPQQSPLLPERDNQYSQAFIEQCLKQGFISVEGQALAYVPIDFAGIDDYLARLSPSRRRDLRRKLRSRAKLRIEVLSTGDACFADTAWLDTLYGLYQAVYAQSEIHFDLLTPAFFQALLTDADSNGRVFCYWCGDVLAGFNLCYEHEGKLIDKYIGLNYPLALAHNLYFVSWFVNLEYALEHGLQYYIAGWTDPQVKASLGAQFTHTRHLVWVRNPLLRKLLQRFRHHFESDAQLMGRTS